MRAAFAWPGLLQQSGHRPRVVAVLVLVAAVAATWLMGERSFWSLVVASGAWGGALAVAVLAPRRGHLAFGVLFLLASLSRLTAETPFGTMRPEQPAIAAALAILLIHGVALSRREVHRLWPIGGALLGYLLVTLISSALVAPDRIGSLRFTFWTALSIASGFVAYVLVRSWPRLMTRWLVAAGVISGGAAIVSSMLFLVIGPAWDIGIQISRDLVAKAFALSWEANLHASFLAALTPFVVDRFRRRHGRREALMLGVVIIGFALGLTRAAYLGLGAGLLAYFGAMWWTNSPKRPIAVAAAAVIILVVVSAPVASFVLPGGRAITQQSRPTVGEVLGLTSYIVVDEEDDLNPQGEGEPRPTRPRVVPLDVPEVTPGGADTIAYRLERIGIALREVQRSPVVGLGADSYGQRHAQPDNLDQRDHLGMLGPQLLYDSGILGALAFVVAMALIIWRVVRAIPSAADDETRGSLAAYFGAVLALLVAYQATNAIHFAYNWLLIGAALALALSVGEAPAHRDPSRTPAAS